MPGPYKIETTAVHAGRCVDPATGAVTPPIHLSATFERGADGEYPLGFSYSREDNPNRRALSALGSEPPAQEGKDIPSAPRSTGGP